MSTMALWRPFNPPEKSALWGARVDREAITLKGADGKRIGSFVAKTWADGTVTVQILSTKES